MSGLPTAALPGLGDGQCFCVGVIDTDPAVRQFTQTGMPLSLANAMAWRVKKWKFSGSISMSYHGSLMPAPSSPDLTFDASAVSALFLDGAADTGGLLKEQHIFARLTPPVSQHVTAQMDFAPSSGWLVRLRISLGFPLPPAFLPLPFATLADALCIQRQNKLYFPDGNFQLDVTGPAAGSWTGADMDTRIGIPADPSVTLKLMGKPRLLFGGAGTDWTASGEIDMDPAEWWAYDGMWDAISGLPV